jgi:hypothetical protein
MTRAAKIPTSVNPYILVHNMTKAEIVESIKDIKRVAKIRMPITMNGKALTKQQLVSAYGAQIISSFEKHPKVKGENVKDVNTHISESRGWFAPISTRPRVFNTRPPTISNVKYTTTNKKHTAISLKAKSKIKAISKKVSTKIANKKMKVAVKKIEQKLGEKIKNKRSVAAMNKVSKKVAKNVTEQLVKKPEIKKIIIRSPKQAEKIVEKATQQITENVVEKIMEPTKTAQKIIIKNPKDIRRVAAGKKAYLTRKTKAEEKAAKELTSNIFAKVIKKAEEEESEAAVKQLTSNIFANVIQKAAEKTTPAKKKLSINVPSNRIMVGALGRPQEITAEQEAALLENAINKRLIKISRKKNPFVESKSSKI